MYQILFDNPDVETDIIMTKIVNRFCIKNADLSVGVVKKDDHVPYLNFIKHDNMSAIMLYKDLTSYCQRHLIKKRKTYNVKEFGFTITYNHGMVLMSTRYIKYTRFENKNNNVRETFAYRLKLN